MHKHINKTFIHVGLISYLFQKFLLWILIQLQLGCVPNHLCTNPELRNVTDWLPVRTVETKVRKLVQLWRREHRFQPARSGAKNSALSRFQLIFLRIFTMASAIIAAYCNETWLVPYVITFMLAKVILLSGGHCLIKYRHNRPTLL